MDTDSPAAAPRSSRSRTEPFIGLGYVILYTVLLGGQAVLMVLRFRGWWSTAPGNARFEGGLVLMLLLLPCVQLWRVHWRLRADDLVGDPQSTANSFALTKFLASSFMTMVTWMFLMSIILTSLFGRAIHAR